MKNQPEENGAVIEQKLDCILLVDDDEATNFIHKTWLRVKNIAHEVISVNNGQKAIEYLNGQGDRSESGNTPKLPDVILLDVNMPVMDGWEFLDEFKGLRNSDLKNCRIFMLTSSPNPQDEQRARSIPEVTGFFRKPITKEMIAGLL